MAKPVLQRKRSSDYLQEIAARVITRQPSERTVVANRIENSLHLGNASPVVQDQVLSLSPREAPDDSLFFDGISTVFKDSPIKKFKPDIEGERCPKPEIDCLSKDIENEHVSFNQTVVDDVPKTQTTDVEQKGEDEPDGPVIFFRRLADKVTDTLRPSHHHDHHHENRDDGVDLDLEGFSVHLPARIHQYVTPCPFGARLRRSNEGYKLVQVFDDTAAHKAGLRESDIVTHLNDIELKILDVSEIQKLFMDAETVFMLTILRKCVEDNEVHLKKTIIKVTIGDEILVEVVHEEKVWTRRPRSAISYITQDGFDVPQTYLNVSGDSITMGSYTDERAQFVLDFYHVFHEDNASGQRCVIRNATTDQIYDAVQNNMKTMENHVLPDQACMLDKIPRNDGNFVFESVHLRGHYLIYQRSSNTLKLFQYCGPQDVTNEGSFDVIPV